MPSHALCCCAFLARSSFVSRLSLFSLLTILLLSAASLRSASFFRALCDSPRFFLVVRGADDGNWTSARSTRDAPALALERLFKGRRARQPCSPTMMRHESLVCALLFRAPKPSIKHSILCNAVFMFSCPCPLPQAATGPATQTQLQMQTLAVNHCKRARFSIFLYRLGGLNDEQRNRRGVRVVLPFYKASPPLHQ